MSCVWGLMLLAICRRTTRMVWRAILQRNAGSQSRVNGHYGDDVAGGVNGRAKGRAASPSRRGIEDSVVSHGMPSCAATGCRRVAACVCARRFLVCCHCQEGERSARVRQWLWSATAKATRMQHWHWRWGPPNSIPQCQITRPRQPLSHRTPGLGRSNSHAGS